MYMETRNSKTEIPLFKVKDEKIHICGRENNNETIRYVYYV